MGLSTVLFLGGCAGLPTGLTAPVETPRPQAQAAGASNPSSDPVAAGSSASAASGTTLPGTSTSTAVATASSAAPVGGHGSPQQNLAASAERTQPPSEGDTGTSPTAAPPATPSTSLRALTGAQDLELGDRSDLWERVRQGFAMPDLDSDLVKRWEQWYATRPDYVQRMTERGGRYLFHVVEEVHKRGLPMELALLPFIESAFNPQALSVASASGMWQFMPATGLQYELKQNLFRDDRRDVLASTRAALDYLQMLHRMFDDWHLALAAYNWGQGNVQRALERNRRARQDLVYTALRMPDETRNYVPKLQAVKNIVMTPGAFGLTLPKLENHPFFLTVNIDRDMDAELVARLAGLSMDEFQALNPQLNKPVLLAAGTPQVLLPYDSANQFVRAMGIHSGPWASWTAWVAPRTMRPAEAAKLVGLSEARLRELNKIPEGMVIKAGSALIVPRSHDHTQDVTEQLADQARIQLAPDGQRTVRRTVKAHPQGESLAAFARRHGHSVTDLAQWNKLSAQAMLRPGQALTVMSVVQASAGQPRRGKAAAPAAGRKERAGAAARTTPKSGQAARPRAAAPR
jgi:membrane-bound lytic murein transglycosylase D